MDNVTWHEAVSDRLRELEYDLQDFEYWVDEHTPNQDTDSWEFEDQKGA